MTTIVFDGIKFCEQLWRGPPTEYSHQVWFKLTQRFRKKLCLKELLTPHDSGHTTDKAWYMQLPLSMLCSGELKNLMLPLSLRSFVTLILEPTSFKLPKPNLNFLLVKLWLAWHFLQTLNSSMIPNLLVFSKTWDKKWKKIKCIPIYGTEYSMYGYT